MSSAAQAPAVRDRLREAEERILEWATALPDLDRSVIDANHPSGYIYDSREDFEARCVLRNAQEKRARHYELLPRLIAEYEAELFASVTARLAGGGA